MAGLDLERSAFWRVVATRYLAFQGLAVLLWWLLVFLRPDVRDLFFAGNSLRFGFAAFFPPDILLLASGSLIAAYGFEKRAAWAWPALLVLAGASAYAGIYSISAAVVHNEAWLGALLMLPVTVIPAFLAWKVRP